MGNVSAFPYLWRVNSNRTYRRHRLGALLAAATMICAFYAGSRADADQTPTVYAVRPGDTLWGIATRHCPPSEDPRPLVEKIRDLNGMKGYGIRPGQRLDLPAGR